MKKINWKNKVVLGVGAHADDLDMLAGGTFAKAIREGAIGYYCILTNGNRGSIDKKFSSNRLITIRKSEQQKAAKILGIKKVYFFGYSDCELKPELKIKKRLVALIRTLKPDVVIGLDPSRYYFSEINYINHADHRAAGEITIDAVFPMCRDHLFAPRLGKAHKVPYLFLASFEDANYYENISGAFDVKLNALREHKSQIEDTLKTWKWVKAFSKKIGKKAHYKYAESFRVITL